MKNIDQRGSTLEIIEAELEEYALWLHHDDSFPETPNPFLRVAAMGAQDKAAMRFLVDKVAGSWGLPRWEALSALCDVGPEADCLLIEAIIKGNLLIDKDAVDTIRLKKGSGFLARFESGVSI